MDSTKQQELFNKIKQADIVSFDIFDTLLLRNVLEPTDLFKAVEIAYMHEYKEKIKFYSTRIEAESKARRMSENEDITFDEIYKYVEVKLGEAANRLKKLELQLEDEFLIANCELQYAYNYALHEGKTIYIISDMYLSKMEIEKILKNKGYFGYTKLFVSSDIMLTKATGTIYSYIKTHQIIGKDSKWLHVGDNYDSDVINAQKNGIDAFYYKKLNDRVKRQHTETLGDSIVQSIQINHGHQQIKSNYWEKFGTNVAAPLYIGLIQWLVQHLKGKEHIFFLSRDGYFPYRLYELVRQKDPTMPKATYLYASRRAFIYPYLVREDRKTAIETLVLYNKGLGQAITLREILDNIGLDYRQYECYLNAFKLESLNVIVDEGNMKIVKNFLEEIWGDIENVLQQELVLLERYLEDVGMGRLDSIHIFDIGWSGSTHNIIRKITGKSVIGYYFGTLESMAEELRGNSFGYSFHLGLPLKERNFIIHNVMMYEFIFTAPEGSLIKFSCDEDNNILPIMKNVEANNVIYDCVARMQQGATEIFEYVLAYWEYIQPLSKSFTLGGMRSLIEEYRAEDMGHFAHLSNSVGIGQSLDIKQYVSTIMLDDYLMNRKLYNENAEMNLWRSAIVVKDDQGRGFNRREIEKLYQINGYEVGQKWKKFLVLIRKGIRNPGKAVSKVIAILTGRIGIR